MLENCDSIVEIQKVFVCGVCNQILTKDIRLSIHDENWYKLGSLRVEGPLEINCSNSSFPKLFENWIVQKGNEVCDSITERAFIALLKRNSFPIIETPVMLQVMLLTFLIFKEIVNDCHLAFFKFHVMDNWKCVQAKAST